MASLRNEDYTDREMLHVIASAAISGFASSDDIAHALGISDNGNSRAARVAPRLSWMKRYGFIESVDPADVQVDTKGKLWRITKVGHQLMGGRLTKAVEGAIDKGDPGAQLLMMRQLTRRNSSEEVRVAVRREYMHNTANR